MKADLAVWLSGIGYYKLSARRRKMLTYIMLASLAVHVIGLIAFGSWVLIRSYLEEKTVFVAPPPLKTYEPRKLEHRVKVQKRQRSSSRPTMMPRMVSTRPSNLSLPEIKVDPKVIRTTFQPTFKAFSGQGMGVGIGTGLGLGGFGQGVSQFDFFGIRGRGARIVIILDVSISMAEETEELGVTEKGIAQYQRVKQRVSRVIDALNPDTLFNLVVYAETAAIWREEMQPATEQNKNAAKQYILPFNSRVSRDAVGFRSGLTRLEYGLGDYATGGTTRFDLALSLAFKQRPDTILVICDGDVWTTRAHSEAELAAYNKAMEDWRRQNEAALAQRAAAMAAGPSRVERVWVPGSKGSGGSIKERGGGEASGPTEGRWVERPVYEGARNLPQIPPQPKLPNPVWTFADYQNHIAKLHEQFLAPQGRPMPVIHIIGFRSGRSDSDFLRQLASAYKGQFRRVARMD